MDPTIYVPHFELSHTNPRPNPDQTDEYYRRPHPLNDRRLWSRSALIQPPEFPEDYSTLLSCLVNPRRPGVGGTSRETPCSTSRYAGTQSLRVESRHVANNVTIHKSLFGGTRAATYIRALPFGRVQKEK